MSYKKYSCTSKEDCGLCVQDLRHCPLSPGLVKVPDLAFSKFYNLQTIEWPPSLQIVGFSSFEQTAMKGLILPSSCRKIDNWAFAECEGLASAVGHGVDTVGSSAFNQCAALKWLDMPELKKIGTDAFRRTALEAVELPKCEVIYSGGLASPTVVSARRSWAVPRKFITMLLAMQPPKSK